MDLITRWSTQDAVRGLFLLGLLGLGGLAGCNEKYKPSLTDDETRKFSAKQGQLAPPVLLVSGETITVDKISNVRRDVNDPTLGEYLTYLAKNTRSWEDFNDRALPQVRIACEGLVINTLLYQQAKREGGDKMKQGMEKYSKVLWKEFVVAHGGDEASADEFLRSRHKDRKTWEEENRRRVLIGTLMELRMPKEQPVSHREMMGYYERMKDKEFVVKPRLTFRLIDIQPARLQLKDLTADRYSQAVQLAKDLMTRLAAGEAFSDLAKAYSHDPMAGSGGLWDSIDPQSLAEPYDGLAASIATIPVGEVKGPIEIKGHVFIARLEARQEAGYLPLADVQGQIEWAIRRERDREAQEQILAEIAERAKVGNTDEFVSGCIAEMYRRGKAGA